MNKPYSAPSFIIPYLARAAAVLLSALLLLVFSRIGNASDTLIIQRGGVSVRFAESQVAAATEVLDLFPKVQAGLLTTIPWAIDFNVTFLLLHEGALQHMTGTGLIVALAVPERNLILLDVSKMARHSFVLETTMKHELCHLLLHHRIKDDVLPRWLDEGVCQWASNGIAEIIIDRKASSLSEAVLTGRLLPFQELAARFPGDERALLLAYEQSESIVAYMSDAYGNEKLLRVLNRLGNGSTLAEALPVTFGVSFEDLQSEWKRSLKREYTWLTYASVHLYEILFFVAALIAVVGSIKLMVRRKRRKMGEDEVDSQ